MNRVSKLPEGMEISGYFFLYMEWFRLFTYGGTNISKSLMNSSRKLCSDRENTTKKQLLVS